MAEMWQKRKKHHEEVTKLLRDGGEMDQQGRIRSWFGKKSHDRLLSIGHTSVGFEQCGCKELK